MIIYISHMYVRSPPPYQPQPGLIFLRYEIVVARALTEFNEFPYLSYTVSDISFIRIFASLIISISCLCHFS